MGIKAGVDQDISTLRPGTPGGSTNVVNDYTEQPEHVQSEPFNQFTNNRAQDYGTSDTSTHGRTTIPNIASLMSRVATNTSLSIEGHKYLETLKNKIEENGQQPVEKTQLRSLPGVYLITRGGLTVALVMYEVAHQRCGKNAVVTLVESIDRAIKEQFNDSYSLDLRGYVAVHPRDYSKVENMGNYIHNLFTCALDNAYLSMTIDTFAPRNNDCTYSIEVAAGNNLTDDPASPHGVAAHRDYTLQLISRPNRRYDDDYIRREDLDSKLLEVDIYVTFVETPNTNPATNTKYPFQYQPIVHIGDIRSNCPTSNMIPLALAIVAQHTLMSPAQAVWKQSFYDLTNNERNIGELFSSATESNAAVRDEDVKNIFQSYILDPLVVLDVVHGRAVIPGLNNYSLLAGSEQETLLAQSLDTFFGNNDRIFESLTHNGPILYTSTSEYVGYTTWKSSTVTDTRRWDYLRVVHSKTASGAARDLLRYPIVPTNTIQVLQDVLGLTTDSLYKNDVVVLTASLLKVLCDRVTDKLKLPVPGQNLGYYATDYMRHETEAYRQAFGSASTGVRYGSIKPTSGRF